MHPNLNEASSMHAISFAHVQDFLYEGFVFKSQILLFNILENLQIFTKYMSHTVIIWKVL
jgi:hypothetical protein